MRSTACREIAAEPPRAPLSSSSNSNIPVADEDLATRLVAQSLAVDMADEFPDNADELLEAECIEYVPVPWRAKYSEEEWAAKVLALRSSVISEEPETLQQEYVSTVQHHELFGTHFFHVKKVNDVEAIAALPTSMIAAFNSDGLHFCDENRRVLMSYGYADISWRRLCRAVPCVRWRSVATNCATWGAVAQGRSPPARPRRCRRSSRRRHPPLGGPAPGARHAVTSLPAAQPAMQATGQLR